MKTEAFFSIQYCDVARPIPEVPPATNIRRSESRELTPQPGLREINGEYGDNASAFFQAHLNHRQIRLNIAELPSEHYINFTNYYHHY